MQPIPFVSACVLLSSFSVGHTQDETEAWPQWNGPARDGISSEADWSAAGKKEAAWSMDVGLGYSSVTVAGGRLYTMGFDKDAGLDIVWCLDPKSGEEIWTHAYESKIWDQAHGGGTLTTPTVDGDVVYTLNREGNLFSLDAATGEVNWHHPLKEEYELEYPTWGFSASPLVIGDRLIINVGRVLSIEKGTGNVEWITDKNYGHAYSTPTPFDLEGKPVLAVFNSNGIVVMDQAAGAELYFHEWTTKYDINAASPIVVDDTIFISSGQGKGCALLAMTDDGLEPVWESKVMGNKMSGCVLMDGHLYGFDESVLKCIDLADGEEKWAERGIGNGALIGAPGKLILMSSRGELIVGEATPAAYSEVSRAKLMDGGVYWTKPVLSNGLIYCRSSLGELVVSDHRAKPPAAGSAQ